MRQFEVYGEVYVAKYEKATVARRSGKRSLYACCTIPPELRGFFDPPPAISLTQYLDSRPRRRISIQFLWQKLTQFDCGDFGNNFALGVIAIS